jgi:D-alanyl-D-alanine carboxypeptidase/D-alanyl-D-alanine-endopeptidase (penicillin-binding protein 4)
MKHILPFALCLLSFALRAQTVSQKLQTAFTIFEKDEQLKHAISSLYVIDAKTGQVVFDKNAQIGLVPASTQKIITSVTAFELLGKEYRYKTDFGYKGNKDEHGFFKGNFYLIGHGDPTLGSPRYERTLPNKLFESLVAAVKKTDFKKNYKEDRRPYLTLTNGGFENSQVNDRWIYQDIGNYYGALHSGLNWMENQFDIFFETGDKIGDKVEPASFEPSYIYFDISRNQLTTAAKGSGDNAYVYPNKLSGFITVKGTLPMAEKRFKISASHPEPEKYFADFINSKNIKAADDSILSIFKNIQWSTMPISKKDFKLLYTHYSPSLDSIIYWFNKKSINLYGEALIKTFAYEKQGFGSTDSGVAIVKKFWKGKGLDVDELNIYDGSGLSPMNRVTTHAQVEILKYAKTKDWYPYFLKSLPEYNGITMKSGTIGDVKGFCGYHKAKDGKVYIFSFLVNNYSGKTRGVVGKMYKVLDELK